MSPQRAVVLNGPKDLRVQQRPVWPPSSGQVQVRVISTGLCGSDLHYYLHARNGDFAMKSPLVLGHESSGIVTAVGPGVDKLHIGQRVVIEPGIMCNACKYCDQDRYNLCPNLKFCSSAKTFPHADGTLQEYMNHPAHVVHPIPDTLPLDVAALAEPLSVLLHASSRASIATLAPKSVLVFGVGTIGVLACAIARSHGVKNICAVDINDNRLAFAKEGGWADSTYTLPITGNAKPRTIEDSKRVITNALAHFKQQEGFDLVYECTGVESCIQMSIFVSFVIVQRSTS
jgi:L-iditol 2-dehydrogenase